MANTLLEFTRASHEEIERLERLIVKLLLNKSESSSLVNNHRIKNIINSITSTTQKLIEIYEDRDSSRKDEITALAPGGGGKSPNVVYAFYDALKRIHEYHRRYGNNSVVDAIAIQQEADKLLDSEPDVKFTGEEGGGRFLDLHELYNVYINSKFFGKHIEYSDYLDVFSEPCQFEIALSNNNNVKLAKSYKDYLLRLLEYLTGFYKRIEPLQDIDLILSKLETQLEQGWENKKPQENLVPTSVIDLDYYSTVEELMELGADKLKEALAALGLKVGGRIKQRAERLLLTKNTPIDQLDKKHLSKQPDYLKEISLLERKLKRMCELMSKVIEHTKENIERKQALTYEELNAEIGEEGVLADSESDDEEEQEFYNPLELPMGWDGKPIPYWLYKLHGLKQNFKCEICGDHSYRGRRDFERHFKESRHQYGMHCLGIPNSNNFYEVTSIEEAKALWAKIQEVQGRKRWRPDDDEENEDDEGNVYSKKMYTDLKRQCII